jgi:PTH1 family peptidyl-tRNA hydrolase
VRIVLGIGNPGGTYAGTRHNCGFLVIDELARRAAITSWHQRFHGEAATWHSPQGPVLLLKPGTYVNASGEAAQAAMAFHKVAPAELLVAVDDIHLPLGSLRLRETGSAGGHNGLKDIEARIGPAYPRLRLGIGSPAGTGQQQIDHVLGRFTESELPDVQAMVAKACDAIGAWLAHGCAAAARFNGPLRPPPPPPRPAGRGDESPPR